MIAMSAQFHRPPFQLTVEWGGQKIELTESACHERMLDSHIVRTNPSKVALETLQLYYPYYTVRKG
jgi:hypothetical protein